MRLREAGAKFELEQVNNKEKKTRSGADFWQINPRGYVPVMELDDGERITENPAVLQYIGDQFPAAGLVPACGTMDRYRVQEWLNFVGTEVHKPFGSLFKANTPEDYKPIARENLSKRYTYLEEHLASHQYLHGDKFSIADFYLFVITRWLGSHRSRREQLAECKGLSGTHHRAAEGAGGDAGGGIEKGGVRIRKLPMGFLHHARARSQLAQTA